VLSASVIVVGCGGNHAQSSWPQPNHDLAGTRAASGSTLDAGNVSGLRARWRFTFSGRPGFSGLFASTPVSDGKTVYVEDLESTVFAIDAATGRMQWRRPFGAANDGPNGLALSGPRVFGATDSDAFALSRATGRLLWRRHLTSRAEQFVDVAPVAWKGLMFVSTIGYRPYGRGAIYALDAATGKVRWKFVTVEHPWRHPLEAGGGGLWYPVSVDASGRLYAGNSNPTPWGGSPKLPNGAAFPGPVPYTDSLIVLAARTGRLLWSDQVTPHDVRDHDFQATPILASVGGKDIVFGAGKAGTVIAWNRMTRTRLWRRDVGLHLNDAGPLPRRRVTVCPGLLGGVETPMAYAAGRLFVPVVDLCGWGSAIGRQDVKTADPAHGRGRLVALDAATGGVLWQARLGSPDFGCATVSDDVVFTSTYDGTVYALRTKDGKLLWRARMTAGINACPAVLGDILLVGSGIRHPHGPAPALVAFGLR
jgi:outer membrane protein assembly factor BamB